MEKESREEYTLLGEPWEESTDEPQEFSRGMEELESYRYFRADKIADSVKIPKKITESGKELCRQEKVGIKNILCGYARTGTELLGEAEAYGISGKEEFPIRLSFSRAEITGMDCRCPKCRRNYYYSWYTNKTDCPYVAGLLLKLKEYLTEHSIGDSTDMRGIDLLNFYQERRANQIEAKVAAKEESLKLVPRLTRKGGKLSVAFKIGEKRLFIIKKLDDFCRNVENSATEIYGTSTQINHDPENFTETGKGWIRFINRIVDEEEEFLQRLSESRNFYTYRKTSVGSELSLFGRRLDEFYAQMDGEDIEFEDKDSEKRKKGSLSRAVRNPKVSMRIRADYADTDDEFQGIWVSGTLPDLYLGTETGYYIANGHLNRVDGEFLEKIKPLASLSGNNGFSFRVGRNHLAEFYYKVLPQLRDIVDVTEEGADKIRAYLLPEAQFTFYLDAAEQNVTCKLYAKYGDKEVSVLDLLTEKKRLEPFRDVAGEDEVLFQTMRLLPEADLPAGELHCGENEDLVYQMMESGTQKLMEMGEVRCTRRFLNLNSVKSVKVSVGVSVSSGLLELDISTDDISHEELLDILNGYKAKKKYYRMKDGSFVDLNDNSLEMLAELMDSAHIKPKEFVKGKMHLPMYRTLYLDKMLEENDSVYSSRDSHFREVVKGFKTIKDADFEEPKSLSGTMRNYQKNGYKWLRTLEAWKFGGILADDMGLGKTLQVISVLLAAKEEGKKGTSLVVVPASVVFNWGEEFERFAPTLRVSLITGTQEERQAKIGESASFDVLVTSYDLLKRDVHLYEEKQFLYEIIDEAQYIKNHTTAAAKAVKVIKSQIRYALTGTPIENRLSELWSIFDYLMPGFLYGYDVFKKEIETPIVKNGDEAAMKRLQKMTAPFILRRLKENVLKDLPKKLEESRYVKFEDTQQKLYDGQVVHMKESIAGQDEAEFNKNKIQILAELMRLRQICCDPSLCFENYKGGSAKSEACLELIKNAMDGGHRMLVFSQFKSMLEILQEQLKEKKIPCYMITGGTSKEKRLQMVKEFNEGDVPVFLISLKAGGVGLNLTGADVVIHYDPWWNVAAQSQATDRAHRIGQTKKVTVYKLIAKNTIEEKIQKLQETKKNLAEQVIGGELGQLGGLNREELLDLLEVS